MPVLAWICLSVFPVLSVCIIPDEQRLLEKLLADYNPAARPVYNASKVVLVKFGITLAQISDMVRTLFPIIFCLCFSCPCEKNSRRTETVAKNLERL